MKENDSRPERRTAQLAKELNMYDIDVAAVWGDEATWKREYL